MIGAVHIIVVGAGEVGSYVADRLSREGHDVAVVERDPARRRFVDEHFDVLTVLGSGTHPETLIAAGVERAELLVAVTKDDAANMMASLLAKQFGVERTIVRVEAAELRCKDAQPLLKAAAVDMVIDPDEEVANEILELLDFPGASEVAVMGDGEIVTLGARLGADAPLVGRSLRDIGKEYEPDWDFIVGSITRGNQTIIPRGDYVLEAGDLVRLVCKRRARRLVSKLLGLPTGVPNRVMLLGGGRTGTLLARKLTARGVDVLMIERDEVRARELAEKLDRTLIIQGDITDAEVLDEADVRRYDVVVALTGEDDANILACLYAKSAGTRETIAVVHRLSLLSLLNQAGVDVALSPRTASANGVLRFVRGDVAKVATFLEGDAELLEFSVREQSFADGKRIDELELNKEVLISAILRDGKPQIARGRTRLRKDDHIVVFAKPQAVDGVARLFG